MLPIILLAYTFHLLFGHHAFDGLPTRNQDITLRRFFIAMFAASFSQLAMMMAADEISTPTPMFDVLSQNADRSLPTIEEIQLTGKLFSEEPGMYISTMATFPISNLVGQTASRYRYPLAHRQPMPRRQTLIIIGTLAIAGTAAAVLLENPRITQGILAVPLSIGLPILDYALTKRFINRNYDDQDPEGNEPSPEAVEMLRKHREAAEARRQERETQKAEESRRRKTSPAPS